MFYSQSQTFLSSVPGWLLALKTLNFISISTSFLSPLWLVCYKEWKGAVTLATICKNKVLGDVSGQEQDRFLGSRPLVPVTDVSNYYSETS